jgi:hypothetical protein
VTATTTWLRGEALGVGKGFTATNTLQAPTPADAERWCAVFNGQSPEAPARLRAAHQAAAREAKQKRRAEAARAAQAAAAHKAQTNEAAAAARQGLAAREAATSLARDTERLAVWEAQKAQRLPLARAGWSWEGRVGGPAALRSGAWQCRAKRTTWSTTGRQSACS